MKALLHGHPLGTFQEKKQTIEIVLNQIPKKTVQKYFIHCGLCFIDDYDISESECTLISDGFEQ